MPKQPKKKVAIIGVPMDLGGNRRGVDMGPSAIRATQLHNKLIELGYRTSDYGDVDVPIPEECRVGDKAKKYASQIRNVCLDLEKLVLKAVKDDRIPITLGGDHSLAMGSIGGVSRYYRQKGQKIGLIWVDAHGDMNIPESSGTGNVHGMPFAHVMGMGDPRLTAIGGTKQKVAPENACLVGIRDIDQREKELIAKSGVKAFTMKELDRYGLPKVMEEVIKEASRGTVGIHVSFDIDVVDPSAAPGVGTPKKGGISYREAHLIMELIADSGKLLGIDMVEVNPILDVKNSTAELASELILSGLGKRIL